MKETAQETGEVAAAVRAAAVGRRPGCGGGGAAWRADDTREGVAAFVTAVCEAPGHTR